MGDKNDSFKKIVTELKSRNSELEDEIENLESGKRKFERENRLLKKKVDEFKSDLEECQFEKEALEKAKKSFTKELKDLKTKIKDEEENEKFSEEIQELRKKLITKENILSENNKTMNEMKQNIEDLQDKLNSSEKILKEGIMEKDKELEIKNFKIISLEEDIEKKNKAIESIRKNVDAENEKRRMLERKMSTQLHEIDHQHAKVENMNETYERTAFELDGAKLKILELEKEISNLRILGFNRQTSQIDVSFNPTNEFPTWWNKHRERK